MQFADPNDTTKHGAVFRYDSVEALDTARGFVADNSALAGLAGSVFVNRDALLIVRLDRGYSPDLETRIGTASGGELITTALPALAEALEQLAAVPEPPASAAPGATQVGVVAQRIGALDVVDVGGIAVPLAEVLGAQVTIASQSNQRVLVMLARSQGCPACASVSAALADPRMQQALANVRLVRIDQGANRAGLATLGMQTSVLPVFALIGPDSRPTDAINGGEWDADTAENVAPVLTPFVAGTYTTRRDSAWSLR